MPLSLTIALIGSGLSCAVLCYVMVRLRRLPDAPEAFGWWSLAFALGTVRFGWRSLQPWIGLPPALFGAEALQASAAILLLVGVGRLIGFRPWRLLLIGGIALVVGWAATFVFVRFDLVALSVPLHLLAGAALSATAIALFREHRRQPGFNLNLAVPPFFLWGLIEFLYPLTLAYPWLVPWYLLSTQAFAVIAAIGLVVGALRRFQERTRRAEDRLAASLEIAPAQLALFDASGSLVQGNTAYRTAFGPEADRAPESEPNFTSLMQRLSERRRTSPTETDDRAAAPAAPSEAEFEALLPDGRTLAVRQTTTPDGGRILAAVDISAKVERERELLQLARLLRGTLDAAKMGIAVFTAEGAVVAWSDRFIEALELSQPLAGMSVDGVISTLAHRGDLGAGAPWDLAGREIARAAAAGEAETALTLPSGRRATLTWHAVPGGGTILCALPAAAP